MSCAYTFPFSIICTRRKLSTRTVEETVKLNLINKCLQCEVSPAPKRSKDVYQYVVQLKYVFISFRCTHTHTAYCLLSMRSLGVCFAFSLLVVYESHGLARLRSLVVVSDGDCVFYCHYYTADRVLFALKVSYIHRMPYYSKAFNSMHWSWTTQVENRN